MHIRVIFQQGWAFLVGLIIPALFIPGFTIRGDAPLSIEVLTSSEPHTYDKVEARLPTSRQWANPYDPSEVSLAVEVTGPSGASREVPAFYYQPQRWRLLKTGSNRQREWIHPSGLPEWRARFTLTRPGEHRLVAILRTPNGEFQSAPVALHGRPGKDKGYVGISNSDPRFFAFKDGAPFFPVGQNLAFIGNNQYLNSQRVEEVFARMSEHGANYARIWVCAEDWALAIEGRKSAWGRSWDWNPPFAPNPGRQGYHAGGQCIVLSPGEESPLTLAPCHPITLEPGVEYRLTGMTKLGKGSSLIIQAGGTALGEPLVGNDQSNWIPFRRRFTAATDQWWLGSFSLAVLGSQPVYLSDLSLSNAEGGPNLLWEADPNRPPRGVYNQIDSYLLDRVIAAAEKHGVYLQLCLLTRDHYRHDLADERSPAYRQAIQDARHLLRYAVARWGYSPHVLSWEYFNEMDPKMPTAPFYQALSDYLTQIDPYRHLRTSSAWSEAPSYWNHPALDVADMHWYLRPTWGPLWKDATGAVLDRAQFLLAETKGRPALLSEFGLATDSWGRSPFMAKDTNLVHFHNSLWASTFSGLSGTTMFWWWETLDQLDAYRHYGPLTKFIQGIPFAREGLKAMAWETEKEHSRVLAWRTDRTLDGWIATPNASWWNVVVEKEKPTAIQADPLVIPGLKPGDYQVEWWDTSNGTIISMESFNVKKTTCQLIVPSYVSDIAFRIRPSTP